MELEEMLAICRQNEEAVSRWIESLTYFLQNEAGLRLKKLRMELNISQGELSRQSGVSESTISRIEWGIVVPEVETVAAIERAIISIGADEERNQHG